MALHGVVHGTTEEQRDRLLEPVPMVLLTTMSGVKRLREGEEDDEDDGNTSTGTEEDDRRRHGTAAPPAAKATKKAEAKVRPWWRRLCIIIMRATDTYTSAAGGAAAAAAGRGGGGGRRRGGGGGGGGAQPQRQEALEKPRQHHDDDGATGADGRARKKKGRARALSAPVGGGWNKGATLAFLASVFRPRTLVSPRPRGTRHRPARIVRRSAPPSHNKNKKKKAPVGR